jgi:hypothetical protein
MYVETFDGLDIARTALSPSSVPFHGVILGHQACPLGRITHPITFGDPTNFCTERLQFEVVDFPGCYNAILERLCYTKFMVVPNYTYLKLKILRPRRIITATASRQRTPVNLLAPSWSRHLSSHREEIVRASPTRLRLTLMPLGPRTKEEAKIRP